jgi:hypothetical protein
LRGRPGIGAIAPDFRCGCYKFEGKQRILTFPMAASGAAALQALFVCAK